MVLVRTIWLSDWHLGTTMCRAAKLLSFLKYYQSEQLYLVGDIVDGWAAGKGWHWTVKQQRVVDEIERLRLAGTRIHFISGNHDEDHPKLLRELFGAIPIHQHLIHTTIKGQHLLVIHGHQFDGMLNPSRWFDYLGHWLYMRIVHHIERRTVHNQVGHIRRMVERLSVFKDKAVKRAAFDYHVDGVICGHIHQAEMRQIGQILYCNTGDWVKSCSALIEEFNGDLHLVYG